MSDVNIETISGTLVKTLYTTVEKGTLDDGSKYEKRQATAPRTLMEAVTASDGKHLDDVLDGMQIQIDKATTDIEAGVNDVIDERVKDDVALKSEMSNFYNELERDSITQFRRYGYLSEPGWYRAATYNSNNQTSARGSAANAVEFNIKRSFNNNAPEEHQILLVGQYRQQHFKSLYDCSISNQQLITKIRYVWTDTKAYIDIYYNATTRNGLSVSINKDKDAVGYDWELCGEAYLPLVEEMIEGETVSTIYEIPANANLATDLDLQNYLPLSGGRIEGNGSHPLSIKGSQTPVYLDFLNVTGELVGAIGFSNMDIPVFVPKSYDKIYKLFHTGNSKAVSISSTAPVDTQYLWIDIINMKTKIYKDGAWTIVG